jgi:uncharacterized membrane-anchored protein
MGRACPARISRWPEQQCHGIGFDKPLRRPDNNRLFVGGNRMQYSHTRALCAAVLLATAAPQAMAQPAPSPQSEEQARAEAEARARAIEASLHPQTGAISIPAAHATLQLGDNYYFLPAEEAKRVLTEGWGNPPDQVADVLVMVFPK